MTVSSRRLVNRLGSGIASLAAAVLISTAPGLAAPQILGLVMTDGPVDLKCEDGTCRADFSGFCLQKDRKTPGFLTPYYLVQNQDVRLTLRLADGATREIPAASHVNLRTKRFYAGVEISLAQSVLNKFAATGAAITIGKHVTAMPVAVAGDLNPLTPADIKAATGRSRTMASAWFDTSSGPAGAVKIFARAINRTTVNDHLSPDQRQSLWQTTLATLPGPVDAKARRLATGHFRLCQQWLARKDLTFGLRQCLEDQHDDIVRGLNRNLWRALKPGS
jgi:hypothetical protein